nr:hypothetical protein L203_02723 [Cryptococcus depauperatus CBS 7841]
MGALRRQPAMNDLHGGAQMIPVDWNDGTWSDAVLSTDRLKKRRSTTVLTEIENTKRIKEVKQPGDKYKKALPILTKRSEPMLRGSRQMSPLSPLSPMSPSDTTTIVLESRRRSFSSPREAKIDGERTELASSCDVDDELAVTLKVPNPSQRFLASAYPGSSDHSGYPGFNNDRPTSHPMVREYTMMGWDANDENSPTKTDGLPRVTDIERTKKGNSKSPWHQFSARTVSKQPSSIRGVGVTDASLPSRENEPQTLASSLSNRLGGPSWPSTSSLHSSPPSPTPQSSRSAKSSLMSYHSSIHIITATATTQARPHIAFLANASDVSILTRSSVDLDDLDPTGSPASLPESLEAECIDLRNTGCHPSPLGGARDERRISWMSRTSGAEIEMLTQQPPSPVHETALESAETDVHPTTQLLWPQTSFDRAKLKRTHTYTNLRNVLQLAFHPGSPAEAQASAQEHENSVSTQGLQPAAIIHSPSALGPPIDLPSRSMTPNGPKSEVTFALPTSPTTQFAAPARPVSLCSPTAAVEQLLPVSPFQSPETSKNRHKNGGKRTPKRSPFQNTKDSLREMFTTFKGRTLVHAFDKAEQNLQRESSLKSKISGPIGVYEIKANIRNQEKIDREWREDVLRDAVRRSLSGQFKLAEEMARQGSERSAGKIADKDVLSKANNGSKTRLPIPGTLLNAAPIAGKDYNIANEDQSKVKSTQESEPSMESSFNLRAVTDGMFVPTSSESNRRYVNFIIHFRLAAHLRFRESNSLERQLSNKTALQRLPGKARPTSAPLIMAWSPPRLPQTSQTLSQLINPPIVINQASPVKDPNEVLDTRPDQSPSPSPRVGRSKSQKVSRRTSILNFFKSKEKESKSKSHIGSPKQKPKKLPSGTFTASIRSSFLALTKHNQLPAPPEGGRAEPARSSSGTPPSTNPLRTPIQHQMDIYSPLSKKDTSFELILNLPPAKPLLDELAARDEALLTLEGKQRNAGLGLDLMSMEKILEWRKELEGDSTTPIESSTSRS